MAGSSNLPKVRFSIEGWPSLSDFIATLNGYTFARWRFCKQHLGKIGGWGFGWLMMALDLFWFTVDTVNYTYCHHVKGKSSAFILFRWVQTSDTSPRALKTFFAESGHVAMVGTPTYQSIYCIDWYCFTQKKLDIPSEVVGIDTEEVRGNKESMFQEKHVTTHPENTWEDAVQNHLASKRHRGRQCHGKDLRGSMMMFV